MNTQPIPDFPALLAAAVLMAEIDAARHAPRFRVDDPELDCDTLATLQAVYDERYMQGAPVRPLASIPSYWLLPGEDGCEVRAVERSGAYYLVWIEWQGGQARTVREAGPFPHLGAAEQAYQPRAAAYEADPAWEETP